MIKKLKEHLILWREENGGRRKKQVGSSEDPIANADATVASEISAGTSERERSETGESETQQPVKKKPLYRRPAFLIVAGVALVLGLVFGLRYWIYARSHETTDDAFINGHIVQVSPKVSGYVARVYVKDNQQVKQGDLVAEIDARDYEAKLEQARAALEAGTARLKEARTGVELTRATSRANVQQASATVQQARSESNHNAPLRRQSARGLRRQARSGHRTG